MIWVRVGQKENSMADQQTGDRQPAGQPRLTRLGLLVLCLGVAALFVTIWIRLASKDIAVEVAMQRPANEKNITTNQMPVSSQGDWYISLASFRLQRDAEAMLKRLEQQGVRADYISFIGSRKDYIWYRVRVSGFASEQEAQEQLVVLAKKLGIRDAWVGKER